jgi:hypothetical protein
MAATRNFRDDCHSGARWISRCTASHGSARHAEDGACACAGLSTRGRDTPGGTRVGAAFVRVRIRIIRGAFTTLTVIRAAFTTSAVIRAGITHVAASGTAVTRTNITRADTSRTAPIRATGTYRCIPVRRHTSRSIADPNPGSSCATKHGDPAQRPNCERPCRDHHASFAARTACGLCAGFADSTRTKH